MPKQPKADTSSEKKNYSYKRSTFYHNGKRYEATGKTQREADRKADEKRRTLEAGEAAKGGNQTVDRWAWQWLGTYKEGKVGEGQYENYRLIVSGIIAPAIGSMRLNNVDNADLQRLLNSHTGKSKSYLSKIRYTLTGLFKRARKLRLIPFDPSDGLELPTAKDGSYRSITDTERALILRLAETHKAGLWVKTLLYCGLRPAETRALDWRHVDFEKRRLHVELAMKSKTKRIAEPKTEAGARFVPIPDKLFQELADRRGNPDEPIFKQETTGGRHTAQSMHGLWRNFKRDLDLLMGAKLYRNQIVESVVAEDLVAYCLRHTFGTDLQSAGVPINVAKYLMGHEDITTTANIYTDTSDEVVENAAVLMNKWHE